MGSVVGELTEKKKYGVAPIKEKKDENNEWNSHVYSRGFQSMLEGLDDEACPEESSHVSEKKRRLRVDQVKALEKNFEVENKLEPERKVKLAQELGLQPRQVAVWFQNRRARWKTKNLERDYNVLKANFDSLKRNYESLQHDNEALLKEICELKSKLHGENNENKVAVKEEAVESESDDKVIEQSKQSNSSLGNCEDDDKDLNYDKFDGDDCIMNPSIFAYFKDGSSDSDSSAILNEQNSPNAAAISSSSGAFLISNNGGAYSSSSNSRLNCFQFLNSNSNSKSILGDAPKAYYQPQFVKMEEHNFFSDEECCSSLFTDEQAPTLQWYSPETEHWNWKDS